MPIELWILVAVAIVIIALFAGKRHIFDSKSCEPLPGRLESEGKFSMTSPNLDDERLREERERDFRRICAAQKDLYFCVIDSDTGRMKSNGLKLVEIQNTDTFDDCMNELSKHFGKKGAQVFKEDGIYAYFSASTPFDFSLKFNFIPMFHEPQYCIVYHESSSKGNVNPSFQVYWAACINSKAQPVASGAVWPFFVCYLSEKIGGSSAASSKDQELELQEKVGKGTSTSKLKNVNFSFASWQNKEQHVKPNVTTFFERTFKN